MKHMEKIQTNRLKVSQSLVSLIKLGISQGPQHDLQT